LITNLVFIATGGAVGSILRFIVSYFCKIYFQNFPIGTLLVNILGSFLIGLFISYLNNKDISEVFIKYFLIVGLLGAFTTFSSFAIEVIQLYEQNDKILSILYICLSIILSILAAYIGLIFLR
tara:strand:+ start:102 stop:470 length:369 start_codon:yes stop_codon:yes gene_type:complete